MLRDKSLPGFTNLFSPNDFKNNNNDDNNNNNNKIVECNSSIIYPNLNDQQQFRLNKISEVRDCFIAEIRERELISKRLSKCIASFDYFDKSVIVSSATSGSICNK